MGRMLARLFAILLMSLVALPARAADLMPIFDAHMHYNWEPTPRYSLPEILALFKASGVTGILATSRPNDGTRAIVEAKPPGLWVVPFIRPYNVRADIGTWFNDEKTIRLIRTEYERGYYRGIGEFHIYGRSAGTDWVKEIVGFAAERGLYLHAHADDEAVEILFGHDPRTRMIWAHTGFSTPADKVAAYLQRWPDLWCELSYRSGITDGAGRLTPEWRALFERFPDRFMLGSDTWIPGRWETYGDIMAGYRVWLEQLPRPIAEQVAYRNAEKLFR